MQKKQALIEGKILTYYTSTKPISWDWSQSSLVFLHGWMQNGKSFEKIFKILEEKNIPYISLDLPGFGSSQLIHDNMTIDEYSQVVIKVIEKLQLKKPVLLGHSFGWRLCISLGSYYRNIDKIVLLCAAWIAYKMPPVKYAIVKTWKIILYLPWLRSLGKRLREGFSSPDMKNAGTMTKIFRNTIAYDLQDKMKQIRLPTLMIWGESDDQTPVSDGKIIHWYIKWSDFNVLEWTHFVHQEKPEEITDMILKFIQK